tara:strand:+ start:848 stop:1198 length:351 start_codon:yes stop_codon:yes gene_type:complete
MSLRKPSIFDTTTFDLKITGLDRTAPDYVGVVTGLTDVVYDVEWTLTATEGSDVVTLNGATSLASPDSSSFTGFNSLTNDIVKGWIINSDPFLHHKYTCCNNILSQRVVADKSVPW